jgi:uroporphyrinogen decarboxylase
VLPLPRASVGLDPAKPAWRPWTLPDGSPGMLPSELDLARQENGDWIVRDDDGNIKYRMPAQALYFEPVHHPFADATTVAEIQAYELPLISDAELAWLGAEAQRLYLTTDKAIMGQTGINIYEGAQGLRGWEQFMIDLAENPKIAQAILEKITDNAIANMTRYLNAVGEYIHVVQTGDDLGTQKGPQLSRRMYRNQVMPYHQRLYRHIKLLCGKPIFLHCCGGIYPLLPDLIEAGVNILNPVQFTATGMEPARLKREFGRDLVFWGGGADTQQVLPNASPAEVREHACAQIQVFAPGGGFVFCQVHNIQAGTPPENIVALFEAAQEFNPYSMAHG